MIKTLFFTGFMLFAAQSLFAEAVFLNDGRIIEGKIISETDDLLTVQRDRETTDIPRSDVLRILYTDDYRHKRYIYTLDGREFEGYIVAEDRDTYTLRNRLESREETTIMKSDVDAVTRRPITSDQPAPAQDEPDLYADRQSPSGSSGSSFSIGLYYQGILDTTLKWDDYDVEQDYTPAYIGAVIDVIFPDSPLGFRAALLYDIADYEDDMDEYGEIDFDKETRLGFGLNATLCFSIHSDENMRFWLGPQLGFYYIKQEAAFDFGFTEGETESETGMFVYGAAIGIDFFLTDSFSLTAEFGYRLISGTTESSTSFGSGDEDEMDVDFSGNSPYLAFGAMLRF